MSAARATVLITTKNRRDDLQQAISSALGQSVPIEIIVIDDGSTDGTSEMVRSRFPTVRIVRHESSTGYIVRRNQGVEMASTPIVFSIDDDAVFPSQRTIEQTLAEFDHERVGAVAIPFIDVRKSPEIRQRAPAPEQLFVTSSFIGTAHALRKDIFIDSGSYRPYLFHQGEEGDYCIRMLDRGYVVRLGNADPIHHLESPKRDMTRMDIYGRRNDILFAWYNTPLFYLPANLLATVINGLRHGVRCGRPGNALKGVFKGLISIPSARRERRPVTMQTFRLFRRMKAAGLMRWNEVAEIVPPVKAIIS